MFCLRSDEGPSNALILILDFQLSIEQAQTVAEQVEMKAKVVQSEVKAVTARHKKALEERECELLWKVMRGACPLRSGSSCLANISSVNRMSRPGPKL